MCEQSYTKFEYKGTITVRIHIRQTRHPKSVADGQKNLSMFNSQRPKNKKISMKSAIN